MSKRRKNGQPSSYSDFILDDLQTMFGIDNKVVMLNLSTQKIEPSQWLLEALDMSSTMSLSTEKAKSEGIVLPVLLALNRLNPNQFKIFSGSTFDVDKSLSLVGRCDFISDGFRITRCGNSLVYLKYSCRYFLPRFVGSRVKRSLLLGFVFSVFYCAWGG